MNFFSEFEGYWARLFDEFPQDCFSSLLKFGEHPFVLNNVKAIFLSTQALPFAGKQKPLWYI